ncbi:reverse transcriptase domain-containing protein, partial [Tanacetum coccineum]
DSEKEDESAQDCFVLPIWHFYFSTITPDLKTDEKREGPREEEQVFLDELERLKRQEKEANEEAEALRKQYAQENENLVIQAGAAKASSTNIFSTVSTPAKASSTNLVNTVSIPVSTASPNEGLTLSDPTNPEQDDSEIPPLEDIYQNSTDGIFTTSSYDDEGAVADFTNLETVVNVSPIPTSRIHSSHPSALILGDPTSAVQTRSKLNKSSRAHAFVSYVQKQRRNNHKDFQHCLFACFLSQNEPKKISEALEDESWVDAMQEELLQFKIQKVWILVDLPYGKKAIGTKWVYRNKKDERGVVVRNKARLVAQGHRQEEGIDYDEHAELKIKKFEEVQALYEKIKRSDEDFISIGSAEDERLIKRMNEKGVDSSKSEVLKEENDSDKENDELRLHLTIAPDEEKEVDYEILDRKYPIKEWKTECLGTKPQTDQAEHIEEINQNVVIRSNGQKRYFSTLMRVLSIFDREDLNVVYQLVMDRYQDEIPEGFDRVLWGDLMVMFNPDDEDEFWNSQLDWIISLKKKYKGIEFDLDLSKANLPDLRTRSQSRNSNRQQQQVPPTFVEPFNLVEPIENQAPPVVTMDDNRTMAQLLEAPTVGYEDAIVVPEITADNFELKHGLLTLVQNKQFFGHDKEDPHAHIRYFNKITSTMKFPNVPSTSVKLMLFPFSLEGATRIWLEKEPPRSILTWDDLVSKFINKFFPPSKTTNLRNEITRFQQRFDETFYEAWDRFNDLLRACPHHGFSELHQLDTFYNALNSNDQDSLNSAAGGNFLDKMPRDCLRIIESKSKVRNSRNKPVVAKVSSSSSTPGISPDVAELKDMVKALLLDKKNQSQAPAPVKAVEESCVTCGGAHSYQNCPATDGNVYRDNIQEYVSQAATANFNQGNTGYRAPIANQIRPPGFPPVQQNQGNNQNRYNQNRGTNYNQGQIYRPPINQPPVHQAPPYQAPAPQTQGVSKDDFQNYVKANDAVMRNMQNQNQNLQNQMTNLTDMLSKFVNSNTASTSGSGTLPSNTITNPKVDLKGITTRSGVAYQGPTIPTTSSSPPKVVERETEVIKDTVPPTNNGSTKDVQPPVVQVQP